LYLDVLLNWTLTAKILTELYNKRNDFNFSIVNFPYLSSDIPASLAYGVYISQLILNAKTRSTYNQFVVRDSILTNKMMPYGFQLSRLDAGIRKWYYRYNDLISPYSLSLGHMLSAIFHANR
jgi:hypothetical protein